MNTPAHLIFGAAAFGRAGQRGVSWAALVGALLPDLSLYLLTGWSLLVLQIPAQVVFGQMYFSDMWQGIFAVDNSLPIWMAGLGVATLSRSPAGIAFAGAGLLHLVFDFALHHDDARRHFWPLSNWVFQSPFSYWDSAHYGNLIGPLEMGACAVLGVVLWRRFKDAGSRALLFCGLAAELAPGVMFALMFRN